ncbi:hypothetical protein SASPL_114565 [Salvia splendens]|uniref:Peroxidase n=1 Tax=Salvia splendens TaxID=180675 RepID=A0A8X9A0H8_SALSN|nr:hypothetical protein SASPL_114565 [Salvia splendens]
MECLHLVLMVAMMTVVVMYGEGDLKTGFCSSSCPKSESIVEKYFDKDPTLAAPLLRLHFHDWLRCIGSSSSERKAFPNLGLRGFQVIDDAKPQLEVACPGVVYPRTGCSLRFRFLPTGRRDGRVSLSSDASNLPGPADSVAVQRQKFAAKGLDDHDLVALVGAHTIGQTDCRFFRYQLYNFTITGSADPSMTQAFLQPLQTLCPKAGDGSQRVALDKDSQLKFDVSFFKNVRDGYGILESDQRLWGDASTRRVVENYAGNVRGLLGVRFNFEFPKAMIKMSTIDVKTGLEGEIRKICSNFN